jgi:hypothetical protein
VLSSATCGFEATVGQNFSKDDLPDLVTEALQALGGKGTLVAVSRQIWKTHESDLRASGDLFYTWQYDIRWAANRLRRSGLMRAAKSSPVGIWELKPKKPVPPN